MDLRASEAAQLAGVNEETAHRYYRRYREAIYAASRRAPRFFGEVEMDQAEFGGRGRKKTQALLKRLANTLPHAQYMEKAKLIRKENKTAVLGILQRGGDVYTHIIKKADKRTLEPIIRLVVEPGSTIYTDEWRSYSGLSQDMYTHETIKHLESYSNGKGVHINGIEAFWSFAKRHLTKFNGVPAATFPLHLKECEFRYNNKEKGVARALRKILKQ